MLTAAQKNSEHLKRLRALRDSRRRQADDASGADRRDLSADARALDAAVSAITHGGTLSTPWRAYALHLEFCGECCLATKPCHEGERLKFVAETTL